MEPDPEVWSYSGPWLEIPQNSGVLYRIAIINGLAKGNITRT